MWIESRNFRSTAARAEGQRPGFMPAQGNALGFRHKMIKALKGRLHHGLPLQGFVFFFSKPRALPWAGMVRTVGAKNLTPLRIARQAAALIPIPAIPQQ
jgi:hypothetical protein